MVDQEFSLSFKSFDEVLDLDWSSLPLRKKKQVPAMFFALFSDFDLQAFQEKWKDNAKTKELKAQVEAMVGTGRDIVDCVPAVCAVMGGLVGQEVIKSISGQGKPVYNLLCFDGTTGSANVYVV